MKKLITICFLLPVISMSAQVCVPNSNSLGFNGTTNYVEFVTQNNLNPTNAITIEAWVYSSAWGVNRYDNSIFCKHRSTPNPKSGYSLRAGQNGTLSFIIAGDSAGAGTSIDWKEVYQASTISLNTWTHVAGTFDGTTLKIYKNGVLVTSLPFTGTISSSPHCPKIGRFSDSLATPSRFWNGRIDEVRVFNRALTQTEIADSMNAHITPSAQNGLIGYWQFNEGTGTILNDSSTSANSGTAHGNAWGNSVPFNTAPPTPIIQWTGVQLYVTNSCPNYQWYLDGNIIQGATGQVYNPTQNGVYTCVDTNANCTSTSLPMVITTLSITENDLSDLVRLSPNPVSDILNVHVNKSDIFESIAITDITGREIFFRSRISSDLNIRVDGLAKGIYLARLYGDDAVITKKFIVE